MRSLCKKAGVQYFRFHALRHAGASIMDNNQVPIGTIQRILGHENPPTTEIYLHNLGNSEVEAMMILEQGMQAIGGLMNVETLYIEIWRNFYETFVRFSGNWWAFAGYSVC
ncbi:MAG: tyrosine-type recombinase/integrase [Desulfocapsa sp.]|nr:tyrosine-type recombinase/integrase [Desulfocapsa sp.]